MQDKKKEEETIYDKEDGWITPEHMVEIVPDIIPAGVKRIIASYYLNDDLHIRWLSKIHQKITNKNTYYLNYTDFESLPGVVKQVSPSDWIRHIRELTFKSESNNYPYLFIEFIIGGITDWGNFRDNLRVFMPALGGLYFQQNYCPGISSRKEFLAFLVDMKLQLFVFYDQSSEKLIPSINEFREVMVINSLYIVNYYTNTNSEEQYAILLIMIKKKDKFIVKKYRKMHITRYNCETHTKPVRYRLVKTTNFSKHDN